MCVSAWRRFARVSQRCLTCTYFDVEDEWCILSHDPYAAECDMESAGFYGQFWDGYYNHQDDFWGMGVRRNLWEIPKAEVR